jgi:hypothetical protein
MSNGRVCRDMIRGGCNVLRAHFTRATIDLPTAATTRSTLRPLEIYIYAGKRFLQSLVLVLSTLIGPGSGLGSADLVNDRELHRGDPVFNSFDNPQPRKFH